MANLAILGGEPVAAGGPRYRWPEYGDEERRALEETLTRGSWCRIMLSDEDSDVCHFEQEWAEFLGVKHCVAVGNGTIALMCALWGLGIEPGDEVIVPAVTFVATASAVALCRGVPVFVDVRPDTLQIDSAAVEAAITPRTRAIIPVHYGGYPCDLDALKQVAHRHGLAVIEDSAHAHGSEWRGCKVGAHITAGAFSFQHGKSLTAGEGGAVVTDSDDLAGRVWSFHNVGRVKGQPGAAAEMLTGNFRMVEWCGAILRAQLRRLPEQNRRRRENCHWASRRLRDIGGLEPLPEDPRITGRGYYFYVLRYDASKFGGVHRDVFLRAMQAEGCSCAAGYGVPVYEHPAFSTTPHRAAACPNAERICADEQVTLWNHLLLDRGNLEDFTRAVEKLRANVDELRSV